MKVFGAGFNLYGQFTSIQNKCIETFQPTNDNIEDIELNHTYIITKTNNVLNVHGFINEKSHQTKQLKFDENIRQISCGSCNTLFLSDAGKIWKLSENSATCDYDLNGISDITRIEDSDDSTRNEVTKIACGHIISCAYSTGGYVYNIPNKLDDVIRNVKDVQCGREHCFILTDDGVVYSFGCGSRGQLGHGDIEDRPEPTQIEALSGIKICKISCGFWHSVALSADGDLYVWGWNSNGQLGLKTNSASDDHDVSVMTSPRVLIIDKNVLDMQCGSRHTILLLDDKKLYGFGWNKYKQLGVVSGEENILQLQFLYDFSEMNVASLKCGAWNSAVVISD